MNPGVYCASHYRFTSDLRRLTSLFADLYGYTAATAITDADEFAVQLGVDFLLSLDKTTHMRPSTLHQLLERFSHLATIPGDQPIPDTIVHVHHGPVEYADPSGEIATHHDYFDPFAATQACFTKKKTLNAQCEYRFAVATAFGDPGQQLYHIPPSPQLRALTSPL